MDVLGAIYPPLDQSRGVYETSLRRRLAAAERRLVAADGDPKKTAEDVRNAERAYRDLEQKFAGMVEPHEFQLIADGITPEMLGVVMAEQEKSLAILSAEGGFLGTIAGRYAASVANLDLILKSYTGEPAKVHRVGRPRIELTHPALTLVLIVQPDVVRELTTNQAFVQRGLAARFLYALPASTVGSRSVVKAGLDVHLANAWENLVGAIFRSSKPRTLQLSAGAKEQFTDFCIAHERRLAPHVGDLDQIEAWGSKLPEQVARIAGIYTLIQDPQTTVVGDDAMRDAIGVADYLAAHAMAALVATPRNDAVSDLGDWIRREGRRRFTVREAHRILHGRAWCSSAAAVKTAATVLEWSGWVRLVPPPAKVTECSGRPPSETYQVNPTIGT